MELPLARSQLPGSQIANILWYGLHVQFEPFVVDEPRQALHARGSRWAARVSADEEGA